MASEEEKKVDDVVVHELPAPPGWIKKFSVKKGITPQRSDIVFVSPTGEEIKTKRQLDQYLKSHPGGPPASEFDWATGDTPRRSTRLSEKSKAVEASASQSPHKKQKRSATKRGSSVKSNVNVEKAAEDEKDVAGGETKEITNTQDAEAVGEKETITGEAHPEIPSSDDVEKKTDAEAVIKKTPVVDSHNEANNNNTNTSVEESNNTTTVAATETKIDDSEKATSEVHGAQNEDSKDAACQDEEGTPVELVVDRKGTTGEDNLKVGQEAESLNDKSPILQEPPPSS